MVSLVAFDTVVCLAQGFRWPEEPENLTVLPNEVKGGKLGQVMRGFASDLGVRCEYGHVGEGPDLITKGIRNHIMFKPCTHAVRFTIDLPSDRCRQLRHRLTGVYRAIHCMTDRRFEDLDQLSICTASSCHTL